MAESLTEERVREIVRDEIRHTLGIEDTDEWRERVSYFKGRKAFWDNVRLWAARSTVGIVVLAVAMAIWEGIKALVAKSE